MRFLDIVLALIYMYLLTDKKAAVGGRRKPDVIYIPNLDLKKMFSEKTLIVACL